MTTAEETEIGPTFQNKNKRRRADMSISDLAPLVCATLQDRTMVNLLNEKTALGKLEEQVCSVELYGEHGDTLWKCDDFRTSGRRVTIHDDDLPYPDKEIMFPRKVWEIPVNKAKRELVLTSPRQVREVRIGLHRWKADLCDMIGLGMYSMESQSHPMRIPFIMENYGINDDDKMGPESLYLAGEYTVTSLEYLTLFGTSMDDENSDWDTAHDNLRDCITSDPIFPGVHDELRVATVELVISGTVKGTLEHFGLY